MHQSPGPRVSGTSTGPRGARACHTRSPPPRKETSARQRERLPGRPCARRRPRGRPARGCSPQRAANPPAQNRCVASERAQLVRRGTGAAAPLHLGGRRWPPSPGMTRRCSRSRCRRLLGAMPVSRCTCSPRMGDVADAARRAPASDARQRGRAPGAGLRHAARQGEKNHHRNRGGTHAARERAQASRARGNRGGTQTRREREHAAARAFTP